LVGTWSVATIPDANSFTFTIDTAPTAALSAANLDFRKEVYSCGRRNNGWKGVQAVKEWQGRYDFTTDYVAHPEQATTKYRQFSIDNFTYSESLHQIYGSDTDPSGKREWHGTGNISASCVRTLSAGGVEGCAGNFTFNSSGNVVQTVPGYPAYTSNLDYIGLIAVAGGSLTYDEAYAANKSLMQSMCAANADLGKVTCLIPYIILDCDGGDNTFSTHAFSGTTQDLDVFITSILKSCESYPDAGHPLNNFSITATINLTETSCLIAVSGNAILLSNPDALPFSSERSFNFQINFSLSAPYTLAQCDADAKTLLNEWDLTRDDIYPWRTDGNCNICPLVSRWEEGGQPGIGYCDTPADAGLLAIYDGTIRGAPINYYNQSTGAYAGLYGSLDHGGMYDYPISLYDKGWFDWAAEKYSYSDDGAGSNYLCLAFGQFVTDALPNVSMATQFTTGATDAGFSFYSGPFSRYKANYQLPVPPWMNYSGGYAATDGGRVYAAKWAEIKEPLPSQNYWGECGAMRVATYLNPDCTPNAGLRWPSAYGICGKARVVNATQAGGNVIIVTDQTCYLKNGDSVDFSGVAGLGSAVTVAGLSGDVAAVTTFTVAGTLTTPYASGGYVQSHGSPDAVWYDLAPKGYFVRVVKNQGSKSAEEGNVTPANGHRGIIAILPEGSPEIDNSAWPAASTVIYSDYGQAAIPPVGTDWNNVGWYSNLQQAMADRFWIYEQDGVMLDPTTNIWTDADPPVWIPAACKKNPDAVIPYVEARLHAPAGMPVGCLQFLSDNPPQWNKMPTVENFGFICDSAWLMTDSGLGYHTQYGVSTNTADALKTSGISSASDAGWGTADATFIP